MSNTQQPNDPRLVAKYTDDVLASLEGEDPVPLSQADLADLHRRGRELLELTGVLDNKPCLIEQAVGGLHVLHGFPPVRCTVRIYKHGGSHGGSRELAATYVLEPDSHGAHVIVNARSREDCVRLLAEAAAGRAQFIYDGDQRCESSPIGCGV